MMGWSWERSGGASSFESGAYRWSIEREDNCPPAFRFQCSEVRGDVHESRRDHSADNCERFYPLSGKGGRVHDRASLRREMANGRG